MPKSSSHLDAMPRPALMALREFGLNLATGRVRRKESLRSWAQRLEVSVSTLRRMEAGDPGVSIGVYTTALWMMNMAGDLAQLARPEKDVGATSSEVDAIRQRLERSRASKAL
jgi:hypothetical protein